VVSIPPVIINRVSSHLPYFLASHLPRWLGCLAKFREFLNAVVRVCASQSRYQRAARGPSSQPA
jgi:hypothetical protein